MSSHAQQWHLTLAMVCIASLPAYSMADNLSQAKLLDTSNGQDWPGYGRSFGEQHFSPLAQIDARNVAQLGLAWYFEMGKGNTVTMPIVVDGVMYFASGFTQVHALDAASGKLLWHYDAKVHEVAGAKLRMGWGSRGLAWWNGKLYVGTQDGRLLALDAKSGTLVWSVMTTMNDDFRFVSGAPRVFDGKVIVGHGGADGGTTRGYVTTYDAETGKQLWRFYTVPGNPADGFEDAAQAMAAKTWAGKWWKHGGGGNVWNAISYDPESNLVYLGTGNGSPTNRRVRSLGRGDNLFLSSIVALDADTGTYKWHYQTNPGESWDYNAAMDMALADLVIGGTLRKVLMTAPKNGFFYVIDRLTGALISAKPTVRVNWTTGIDSRTGRPEELPAAWYPNGSSFTLWPGPVGAHASQAMSYSPQTQLAYWPAMQMPATFDDRGITPQNWTHAPGNQADGAVNMLLGSDDPEAGTSSLVAWNPVTQKEAWRVPTPSIWNGGTLASAGNLVFHGQVDGRFIAYAADSGRRLWSYDAQAPVTASPISYAVNGTQYVTVTTGISGSGAVYGPQISRYHYDARIMPRRVLTFAIGGTVDVPRVEYKPLAALEDPGYRPDADSAARGARLWGKCLHCHGLDVVSAGYAIDLRVSAVPQSAEAFAAVVRGGSLLANGMPRWEEISDKELNDLRQYIRTEARRIAAPHDGNAGAAKKGEQQ
jgi:quinohemoprotein ethanol dehydrogenase